VNPPPRSDLEVEHPLSVLSCHPASCGRCSTAVSRRGRAGRAARCRSTPCPGAPSAAPPDHPQGPDPHVRQHTARGGTLLASASSGHAGMASMQEGGILRLESHVCSYVSASWCAVRSARNRPSCCCADTDPGEVNSCRTAAAIAAAAVRPGPCSGSATGTPLGADGPPAAEDAPAAGLRRRIAPPMPRPLLPAGTR